MKFTWLKSIDWENNLPDEYQTIASIVGIEKCIQLIECYQKTPIYFNTDALEKLAKGYILQNPDRNRKELARELGVSLRFIYNTFQQARKTAGTTANKGS
jgi:hypothetical protein